MGCQQGIVLREKSWTKWLTQFEATDIENSSLFDNLSWIANSYTTYVQCYQPGPVPGWGYLYIIGLTKCSKLTRPNEPVVYRVYVKGDLLCPVQCIYGYLAQRSEIVTQDFIEFFITFCKSHHPASEDLLAQWVKGVMGNSSIDTEIFKPHSTKVALNSAAYKLGMLLQEVLKRGQWSNAGTFSTYYFREIEDLLNLEEQQYTWWVVCCIFVYIYIFVVS